MLRNGVRSQSAPDTSDRLFGDPGEGLVEKMVRAVRARSMARSSSRCRRLLIGAAYVLAGVPNPVLFTVVTIAFAMLPFGAWRHSRWRPHAAREWRQRARGDLRICMGALVMLAGDHFVWPTLVGDAARLPFLFAFVGIFGGLATFGCSAYSLGRSSWRLC